MLYGHISFGMSSAHARLALEASSQGLSIGELAGELVLAKKKRLSY